MGVPGDPGDPGSRGGASSLDGVPPGARLLRLVRQAAGPECRYEGLDDSAVVVAAGRLAALESWVASQKLAAVREIIRRRPAAGHEPENAGGLPEVWCKDLDEELACELTVTRNAAGDLIELAWVLGVRLPLTAAALEDGVLDLSKVRMIAAETGVLSDEDAREAEKLVAGKWAGKTWGQLRTLLVRAVVNIDPEGAARRREKAERDDARVRLWREHAGTAGLAGYGLPTEQALKANAIVQARAVDYRAWGIPGTLDYLRALAYLDLLTGKDSRTRYPRKTGSDPAASASPRDTSPEDTGSVDGNPADDEAGDDRDWNDPDWDEPECDEPGGGEPGDGGPEGNDDGPGSGGGSGHSGGGGPGGGAVPGEGLPANVDLTIPLRDLTGHAQRAGEAHGLGVLDPDLARKLAAEAARHPRSVFRVIVTDPDGHAAGFGQAHRIRERKPGAEPPPAPGQDNRGGIRDGTGLPAAAFTPAGGGRDTWILRIGEQAFSVRLFPIPAGECDHRYESRGYQPGETLRRLVQIRDGECTMPVCVRHPRGCDWEHAVPWPTGKTCSCNGGARCRHDHMIKQSPRWNVEQLPGGLHRWTTPSGLTYTKGPKQYPT